MITVKPIEDNIRKEQLLSRYHCSAADSTILVMKDGVCELGYAAIDLIQGKLLIRNIFLTNGSVQELNADLYRFSHACCSIVWSQSRCVSNGKLCGGTAFIFCIQRVCFGTWNMYHSNQQNCTRLQSASYLKERPKEVSFGLFLPFPLCIVAIDF